MLCKNAAIVAVRIWTFDVHFKIISATRAARLVSRSSISSIHRSGSRKFLYTICVASYEMTRHKTQKIRQCSTEDNRRWSIIAMANRGERIRKHERQAGRREKEKNRSCRSWNLLLFVKGILRNHVQRLSISALLSIVQHLHRRAIICYCFRVGFTKCPASARSNAISLNKWIKMFIFSYTLFFFSFQSCRKLSIQHHWILNLDSRCEESETLTSQLSFENLWHIVCL